MEETVELLWMDEWLGNPATNQIGYLLVEGYRIPHIRLIKSADPANDGLARLNIDDRFGMEYVSEDEIKRWAPILANAMAVSAGFSCYNENGLRLDRRFAPRMGALGSDMLGESHEA